MSLKCGIIGLPNVGKSSFFNAISSGKAESANFPFCTIEPNVGIVQVPDKRLKQIADLVVPERILPTLVTFVDIAGLVKGASEGEGLGNQFLANIREVDAIIHVIRCFEDKEIIHVAGHVDPVFDKEVIDYELQQSDLARLKKRWQKIEKLTRSGNKEALQEKKLLDPFITALTEGKPVRTLVATATATEKAMIAQWQLLTAKPVIYIANIDEETLRNPQNEKLVALQKVVVAEGAELIPICVSLEAEIAQLPEEQHGEFLEMYGLEQTSFHTLIQAAYRLLGLITYFTAGKKEVRAWSILQGTLAPQAAGVIHSDFERGFIKAEVIKLEDFIALGGREEACKQAGKMSIEGKHYIVEDGDIVHFRYNT